MIYPLMQELLIWSLQLLFQTIRDAMKKDKSRVTGDLNGMFGHKPGPAIIGDMEGHFSSCYY